LVRLGISTYFSGENLISTMPVNSKTPTKAAIKKISIFDILLLYQVMIVKP